MSDVQRRCVKHISRTPAERLVTKNEIAACRGEIRARPDEIIRLRLMMKLNPSSLTRRSRISSRSDFIRESGFNPSVRTDLVEKPRFREAFLVGEGGFGPPKSVTTDLQSAPFGRSGIPPYGAGERSRTINLLITNQLLCH